MYTTLKLVPTDGSPLTSDTGRYTNMISLDGKVTITFENKCCYLHTEKGTYRLKESYETTVYYTTIGKWYVCYNGAELSWRDNSE